MQRPIVIVPGYFASDRDYMAMAAQLRDRGYAVNIVPLTRWDWLPTVGGRSMIPILRQIHATVTQTIAEYDAPITLVAHSAGGWISRIYLGAVPYLIHGDVEAETTGLWDQRSQVETLVCLGTPHTSREAWTLRNLNFVNDNYPGAFYDDVRYLCVAGKAIEGAQRWGAWLAYSSYQITCGVGQTWGDGITPIEVAHLDGAENLTLPGIWHSPRSPGAWYGSPIAIQQWVAALEGHSANS